MSTTVAIGCAGADALTLERRRRDRRCRRRARRSWRAARSSCACSRLSSAPLRPERVMNTRRRSSEPARIPASESGTQKSRNSSRARSTSFCFWRRAIENGMESSITSGWPRRTAWPGRTSTLMTVPPISDLEPRLALGANLAAGDDGQHQVAVARRLDRHRQRDWRAARGVGDDSRLGDVCGVTCRVAAIAADDRTGEQKASDRDSPDVSRHWDGASGWGAALS